MDKGIINNKIKLAESIINRELKQSITKKGYVKSGKMRKETSVNITLDGNGTGVDIVVNSTDYFPIINDEANITGDVFKSKVVVDAISNIYSAIIGAVIQDKFDQ